MFEAVLTSIMTVINIMLAVQGFIIFRNLKKDENLPLQYIHVSALLMGFPHLRQVFSGSRVRMCFWIPFFKLFIPLRT